MEEVGYVDLTEKAAAPGSRDSGQMTRYIRSGMTMLHGAICDPVNESLDPSIASGAHVHPDRSRTDEVSIAPFWGVSRYAKISSAPASAISRRGQAGMVGEI